MCLPYDCVVLWYGRVVLGIFAPSTRPRFDDIIMSSAGIGLTIITVIIHDQTSSIPVLGEPVEGEEAELLPKEASTST